MKKNMLLTVGVAFILLSGLVSFSIRQAHGQDNTSEVAPTTRDFVEPIVFQAAGPSVASIQNSVAEHRLALGDPNNGNNASKESGRREINWDGINGTLDTAIGGNPLQQFLVTRGALFTTPDGTGFVQATPAGLATFFNNATYENIFKTFSQFRLFSAIGGNTTQVDFFVPGGGNISATTKGFGAVFTDVDRSKT